MPAENPFTKLPTPHKLDIVADLRFSKSQMQFLAASWDNRVSLYDCVHAESAQLLQQFSCEVPVLSLEYLRGNVAFAGSLDGNVYEFDYENGKLLKTAGSAPSVALDNGVNNLRAFNDSLLITSTFDRQFGVIDPRQASPVHHQRMDKKIFKLDATATGVVLGMSERTVEVYDQRNWASPVQVRESGLKLQINDLKTFPTGDGFAISSIDGRVSIEYFDPAPHIQDKKYAFKCHRKLDDLTQTEVVYPVNSICFNRKTNHLYTSGSDGVVNLWNWETRRRIKQYPRFERQSVPESVMKLDISHDSSLLVVATSDDTYKNARSLEYTCPQPFPSSFYLKKLS